MNYSDSISSEGNSLPTNETTNNLTNSINPIQKDLLEFGEIVKLWQENFEKKLETEEISRLQLLFNTQKWAHLGELHHTSVQITNEWKQYSKQKDIEIQALIMKASQYELKITCPSCNVYEKEVALGCGHLLCIGCLDNLIIAKEIPLCGICEEQIQEEELHTIYL